MRYCIEIITNTTRMIAKDYNTFFNLLRMLDNFGAISEFLSPAIYKSNKASYLDFFSVNSLLTTLRSIRAYNKIQSFQCGLNLQ
jgi:hypothetical protein